MHKLRSQTRFFWIAVAISAVLAAGLAYAQDVVRGPNMELLPQILYDDFPTYQEEQPQSVNAVQTPLSDTFPGSGASASASASGSSTGGSSGGSSTTSSAR